MRRLNKFFLVCMLALSPSVLATDDQSVLSTEDMLIERLSSINDLHMSYVQTDGVSEPLSGEIWLNRPDQFRLEASAPLSQTIVSNGSDLWTWDRDLEQVIITDLATHAEDIPLLLLVRNPEAILSEYEVEAFDSETAKHFVLRSTQDSQMVEALVLSFSEDGLFRVTIENAFGDQIVVNLQPADPVRTQEDSVFEFIPPEGVDVIDDRA